MEKLLCGVGCEKVRGPFSSIAVASKKLLSTPHVIHNPQLSTLSLSHRRVDPLVILFPLPSSGACMGRSRLGLCPGRSHWPGVASDLGLPAGKDGAGTVRRGTWAHRPRTWIEMLATEHGARCMHRRLGAALPLGWGKAHVTGWDRACAVGKKQVLRCREGTGPYTAGMELRRCRVWGRGPRHHREGARVAMQSVSHE